MTSYDLTGRTACARGLGAGMAEALARAGASVAIGDIQEDTGKGTADALKESGARASCRPRRPRGHSGRRLRRTATVRSAQRTAGETYPKHGGRRVDQCNGVGSAV